MIPWTKIAITGFVFSAMLPIGCGTTAPSRDHRTVDESRASVRAMDDGPPAILQAAGTENRESPGSTNAGDQFLDLGAVLEIAGVDNPTINFARELALEAVARQELAEAAWLPSFSVGANLRVHRGNLQQGTGGILNVDSQSLYFGSGSAAVGSGTVTVPGLRLSYPLADTILEPRAARERVMARGSDSVGIRNATMLEVTTAYLELVASNAVLIALSQSEAEFAEIARLTKSQAEAGQGRSGDANRATANLELLRRQLKNSEGEQLALTARLAGMLSMDPAVRLGVPPGKPKAIRLFEDTAELEALIEQALTARPEIAARLGDLAEANTRWRQEELRPWLPTVSVGVSAGEFGGGSDRVTPSFGKFDARTDFDMIAVWSIRNVGAGNRALQERTMAVVGQAAANLEGTRQQVRREVAEAHAELKAASSQMETARSQLATAEDGYAAEKERIRQAEWRPLEAIDSTRQLLESRLELVRAVTAHNIAQFRLLVAVGKPPAP